MYNTFLLDFTQHNVHLISAMVTKLDFHYNRVHYRTEGKKLSISQILKTKQIFKYLPALKPPTLPSAKKFIVNVARWQYISADKVLSVFDTVVSIYCISIT